MELRVRAGADRRRVADQAWWKVEVEVADVLVVGARAIDLHDRSGWPAAWVVDGVAFTVMSKAPAGCGPCEQADQCKQQDHAGPQRNAPRPEIHLPSLWAFVTAGLSPYPQPPPPAAVSKFRKDGVWLV